MQLDEQTRLISERGMVLVGNEEEDEEFEKTTEEEQEKRTRAIVSSDTAAILSGIGSGPLDVRIKKLGMYGVFFFSKKKKFHEINIFFFFQPKKEMIFKIQSDDLKWI